MDYKIIAVDFDGTLCENKWPDIGEPIMEVINYIKRQKSEGAKVILWTCRTGLELMNAVYWCRKQGVMFDAVNQNIPEIIKAFGTDCRKIYADVYIDDLSFNHRPEATKICLEDKFTTRMKELVEDGYEITIEEKLGELYVLVRKNNTLHQLVWDIDIFKENDETMEDFSLRAIEECVYQIEMKCKNVKCHKCGYRGDKYSFPMQNKLENGELYCCCGDSRHYEKLVTNGVKYCECFKEN